MTTYATVAPTQAPAPLTLPARHVAELVTQTCARYTQQYAFTAVLPNGMFGNLRFSQVEELSNHIAAYLRAGLGLQAGDRVAVQLPNSLSYPLWAFGTLKAGCVLVNTNPLYTVPEMVHQLNDSGARVLVLVDLFADKLPEVLAQTKVEHVVLVRVIDLFPALVGFIAHKIMQYWNRIIPPCTVPVTTGLAALQQGATLLREGKADLASYTAELGPTSLAALQYTGGTTGVSKGAMLTHGNLLANVVQVEDRVAGHVEHGKETALAVLPLYHIFAFTANLLYFFHTGARNILVASPRPLSNLQRAFENYPISWVPGVNTLFNGLLNEEWFSDYPPTHLKGSIAGGTALHASVAERWQQVTRTPVIEGYGLTESSPVVTLNPFVGSRPGSIGQPVVGTEVRLVNPDGGLAIGAEAGELAVRGPQVMLGYWQRPDETTKALPDGWLLTGDVAVWEDDGFLRIVDRKKDLIIVSGFNVYPNEVEDCIAKLEGVNEVAVIGLPDIHGGEVVKAYIVPKPNTNITIDQVRAHCRQHLTAYKVPKLVELRTELPKSNVGKVLRRALRDEEQQLATRSVGA
ncbi:AMP-binding protein [Candidatus Viridilinea mediisalina]|uniref:Long-chain-fatty-acid--CoA ligase n=1 Tax=Candidatus Viridilinea mediisalina TaxID=2024553 RepID=A0A2A6RHN7_9CHLR|nr:AMP-binding protein [Candidatus Viridilinea mediisalina]PDW02388.1 long-chain-fatty-acid--CoA ligase [Candidatus Viridilinea mediisalina]